MDKKMLTMYGMILIALQIVISLGIFVTYPQMTSYAVSKDTMDIVLKKLDQIEAKLDKVILEVRYE